MTSVRQNLILAAVMIVGCGVLWIESLSLKPASAFFPRLLLAIIIACALAIAAGQVLALRRRAREGVSARAGVGDESTGEEPSDEPEGDRRSGRSRQWLIAVGMILYALAFIYIGPFAATFLLLLSMYVLLSRERSWRSATLGLLLAAVLTAVLYLLFAIALSVSMPDSLLI